MRLLMMNIKNQDTEKMIKRNGELCGPRLRSVLYMCIAIKIYYKQRKKRQVSTRKEDIVLKDKTIGIILYIHFCTTKYVAFKKDKEQFKSLLKEKATTRKEDENETLNGKGENSMYERNIASNKRIIRILTLRLYHSI